MTVSLHWTLTANYIFSEVPGRKNKTQPNTNKQPKHTRKKKQTKQTHPPKKHTKPNQEKTKANQPTKCHKNPRIHWHFGPFTVTQNQQSQTNLRSPCNFPFVVNKKIITKGIKNLYRTALEKWRSCISFSLLLRMKNDWKYSKINKLHCDLAVSGINFLKGPREISVLPLVNFITLTIRSEMLNTSQNPLYPKY